MQHHSFSIRQLAAIALIIDQEEKNASLSDKMKHMWVYKCFRSRKSEGKYLTLYKKISQLRNKFLSVF